MNSLIITTNHQIVLKLISLQGLNIRAWKCFLCGCPGFILMYA